MQGLLEFLATLVVALAAAAADFLGVSLESKASAAEPSVRRIPVASTSVTFPTRTDAAAQIVG